MSDLATHSPVGASAASTYLKCPLSVSGRVGVPPDDDSEHASMGTAVHSLIEHCFRHGKDAWQQAGRVVLDGAVRDAPRDAVIGYDPAADDLKVASGPGTMITRPMVLGAQMMLDAVRGAHPDRNQGNFWVERKFHCKMIHPLFYGTCDVACLEENDISGPEGEDGRRIDWTVLHVWDYKNGAGVVVEVDNNPQTMYYACGALEEMELWDKVDEVVCHIVQPNAFHQDGKHRIWRTTPDELLDWLEGTLIPGINRALDSTDAVSGPHCIFCPLRARKCPAIIADMEELMTMVAKLEKEGIGAFNNDDLGRLLDLTDRAAMVKKAALKDGYSRAQSGQTVTGWKLVNGKANRQWKDEADLAALKEFGEKAMTVPELKSPAQIDELPKGTTFTATWAKKPDAGLTLVKDADQRAARAPLDKASLFAPVVANPPVSEPRSTRRKAA